MFSSASRRVSSLSPLHIKRIPLPNASASTAFSSFSTLSRPPATAPSSKWPADRFPGRAPAGVYRAATTRSVLAYNGGSRGVTTSITDSSSSETASNMSFQATLTLPTGAKVAQIGLGTWLSKPKEVENAVEIAVRNGYRHLDLAYIYNNQDEVGRALKKVIPSVVKREELFITGKLWNNAHRPELVEKQLDESLEQLGLEYLDLYLIHWPIAFRPGKEQFPEDANGKVDIDREVTLLDTWKAMIALPATGKVRAVGVSNFSVEHIKALTAATGVKPACNQVEAHPYLPQNELLEYAKQEGILVTAYSPLGNNMVGKPRLTEHPTVKEISQRTGATTAQVLIAWSAQKGFSVIPKSVQEDRIISNFKQITLSDEDFAAVSAIGHGNYTRFNTPCAYEPFWPVNLFNEPEEANEPHKPLVGV